MIKIPANHKLEKQLVSGRQKPKNKNKTAQYQRQIPI